MESLHPKAKLLGDHGQRPLTPPHAKPPQTLMGPGQLDESNALSLIGVQIESALLVLLLLKDQGKRSLLGQDNGCPCCPS